MKVFQHKARLGSGLGRAPLALGLTFFRYMRAIEERGLQDEGDMSVDEKPKQNAEETHVLDPRPLLAGQTAEQAFTAIATECCNRIDRYLLIFLDSEDHAGPHKTRVALRRLTTALDAFGAILKQKEARQLRSEAKLIFRALGDVRDSDVLLAARSDGSAPRRLVTANIRLRAKVRAALRKRKAVAFAPALKRRLAENRLFRAKSPGLKARSANVSLVATSALADAWGACLAFGPDIAALSDKKRHALRKRLKTYRYLAEFFAPLWSDSEGSNPLWPDTTWPDTRRSLQVLQDRLGQLNDLSLAQHRLGSSIADDHAKAESLTAASTLWRDLVARDPFWRPIRD